MRDISRLAGCEFLYAYDETPVSVRTVVGQSWEAYYWKTSSLKREESINAHLPVEILFGRLALGKVAPLVLFAWSQCCPEK